MRTKILFAVLFFAFVSVNLVFSQPAKDVHINKIIAKLEQNQVVTGIWTSALHPSNAAALVEFNEFPTAVEAIAEPMLDFILIDMEHQPYDIQALRNFILALNSKRDVLIKGNLQPNISVLVRIPADGDQPVHAFIKQVLDIGVHGVVVPHVRTAEEARKIVSACRYPQPETSPYPEPVGRRGASPWLAAYAWGLTMAEYVERGDVWPLNPNGDLLAVVMIEDQQGIENLDEILKVKGIGAVIFGPYDYSFAAGHPGQTDHPDVVEKWGYIKDICDRHGVPLVGFGNSDNIERLLQQDYKMLLCGHEVRVDHGLPQLLQTIKAAQEQK